MRMDVILRVVTKFILPFVLVFALYVQFHADYSAGAPLFQEGQPARRLFVLTEGEVDIVYESHIGPVVVDTLVAGEMAGWSAIVPPYRTTASGIARGAVATIAIAADALRDLCEDDHELGYRLVSQVARVIVHRLTHSRLQMAMV